MILDKIIDIVKMFFNILLISLYYNDIINKGMPNQINTTQPIPNTICIILIFFSVTILPSEVNLLYSPLEEKNDLHLILSFCVKAALIKYQPYNKGKEKINNTNF